LKILEKELKTGVVSNVSVAEIKEALESLSREERLEVAEYLLWRAKKDDPEWQLEIGRRLDRSLSGHGHTAEELVVLHERLSREGK